MLREKELATKADLIAALAEAKTSIITWVAGLMLAQGAFLAAVMALLK